MRHARARLAFFLALAVVPLAIACKAQPRGRIAAGWRSTPDLTGPAIDVDAGTYETKNPFAADAPEGDASKPKAEPQPDPAIAQAELDKKAAAADKKLEDAKTAVAAGTLPQAELDKITAAVADANEAKAAARAMLEKYNDLEDRAKKAEAKIAGVGITSFIPKGFDLAHLGEAGMALAMFLLNRKRAKEARDLADAAKAEANAHTAKAIVAFDALPDTAAPAEVREAVTAAPAV